MGILTVSEFGDATNVKLSIWAVVYYWPTNPGVINLDKSDEVMYPLPQIVKIGDTIQVGFNARLEYQYDSRRIPRIPSPLPDPVNKYNPMDKMLNFFSDQTTTTKDSYIDMEVGRWYLTRTPDGIHMEKLNRVGVSYKSGYMKVEANGAYDSSGPGRYAEISLVMTLIPGASDNGGFQFKFSLGPVSYTPPPKTYDSVSSKPKIVRFTDFRPPVPPKPVPKPVPVNLPDDMLRKRIGPYPSNHFELKGPLRQTLNDWLLQLKTRPDCQELRDAIRRIKPDPNQTIVIRILGAADGTGNDDINDPLAEKRAVQVKDAIIKSLDVGAGVERSIAYHQTGAYRVYPNLGTYVKLPQKKDDTERWVEVRIDEAGARKVISEARQTKP